MLRRLGHTDLEISPIGLGTWAIGGATGINWGAQDDADSIAAIHRAVERGVNWIDTAAIYGFGHSEEVVERAVREIPDAERPLIFTKCGLLPAGDAEVSHNLEPDSLRREIDDSLRRLGVDVIDLYQVHWPALDPDGNDSGIEEAWRTLDEMRRAGKVREIGVSNFDAAQMERIRPIAPIASLQPPYSMLMRGIEDEILPYCAAHGIGVLGYSPMHTGLLTGRMTRERIAAMDPADWRLRINPAFREPALSRILDFVEVLRAIGDRHGRSPAELAVAWTIRDPVVTGTIVGARSAEQVDGFIGAMTFRLSDAELAEIEAAIPGSYPILD